MAERLDNIDAMASETEGVDRGLVAMFLKMSPEERIEANDNSVRAILELRDAFRKTTKQTSGRGSGRPA